MWKRLSGAGLILFVLICAACSRKTAPGLTPPTPLSDRYVESVNTTSGTLTIDAQFNEDKKPSVINFAQAYARVVTNPEDQNKKDVLVVMLEQPLPRTALSVIEVDDPGLATMDFFEMLRNRDARGVVLRVPADRNPAAGPGEENIRTLYNGGDYDFGHLELELKTLTPDKAEGRIKSNEESLPADVNFVVQLRPDVWTGGAFYIQPATKLSPGQASGQIEIDDRVVKINHAYARLIEFDLFDETKNIFRVWLSEKPLEASALVDGGGIPQAASNIALTFATSEPGERSQMALWSGEHFDSLADVERDYVKHGNDAIEGRVYSLFLVELRDRAYKLDVLFNAAMLPPSASDGPVTSREGEALPADGGDPAKAYLAAMERLKGVKTFDEGISIWLSLVSKDAAERIKKDVQSLTAEQRQLMVEVFAPLENPKLTGGLIKDNKATLRFAGTSKGEQAEEAVNMHLEDGQWKIGRREIRVN